MPKLARFPLAGSIAFSLGLPATSTGLGAGADPVPPQETPGLAAQETDTTARAPWERDFRFKLAKHSYFKKVAFHDALTETASFAVFLQRQVVENQLLRTCQMHRAQWLVHRAQNVQRDFVLPRGLKRRAARS